MSYTRNIAAIEELASSEGGIFTSRQAARAGIPRYALSHAAKSGRIERLRHGAYRLSSLPSTAVDELKRLAAKDADDFVTFEFRSMVPIKGEDEYRGGYTVVFDAFFGPKRVQRVSVDLVADSIAIGEPRFKRVVEGLKAVAR